MPVILILLNIVNRITNLTLLTCRKKFKEKIPYATRLYGFQPDFCFGQIPGVQTPKGLHENEGERGGSLPSPTLGFHAGC